MIVALVGFFVVLYLGFAARSLDVALRSSVAIGDGAGSAGLPNLSIIVPARNEERQIEPCVRSLLGQRYPSFEVIVVDDRSEDRTADILEHIAREDERLRVVRGETLPAGWVGKPWALHQGVQQAGGQWLLFTDADTEHEPQASAAAMRYARDGQLDALSLLTDQVMVSAAERIFLPSILWTIAFVTGPLALVNDPKRNNALFNGQYILIHRAAYDAIGGYAALRADIAEDLEMARRFKDDGRFRTALVGANGLVRTRMYRSFREIWEGFVKNFALGVRGRPVEGVFGIAFFACISPLGPLAMLALLATGHVRAAGILAGALVLAVAGAAVGMQRMRFPRMAALFLPVGIATMAAIFLVSMVAHARGGVTWRGRRYSGRTH